MNRAAGLSKPRSALLVEPPVDMSRAEALRLSGSLLYSATRVIVFLPNGEPAEPGLDGPLVDRLRPLVAALGEARSESVWVAFDGWSGELVRVDGGLGTHYMAWLHRASIAAGAELVAGLSERQRQVARRAVEGETAAEMGQVLGISVHTVRDHLKSIYRRLDVSSRLELADLLRGYERLRELHASANRRVL